MEKVKVTRYMTGKRPDWAPEEFDSDEELQLQAKKITIKKPGNVEIEKVSFFKSDTPRIYHGTAVISRLPVGNHGKSN